MKRCSTIISHQGNTIKTTMRYFTHTEITVINERQAIIRVGKNGEKLELLHMAGGNAKRYSFIGKEFDGSSKN